MMDAPSRKLIDSMALRQIALARAALEPVDISTPRLEALVDIEKL